jgi:hypothetical protein
VRQCTGPAAAESPPAHRGEAEAAGGVPKRRAGWTGRAGRPKRRAGASAAVQAATRRGGVIAGKGATRRAGASAGGQGAGAAAEAPTNRGQAVENGGQGACSRWLGGRHRPWLAEDRGRPASLQADESIADEGFEFNFDFDFNHAGRARSAVPSPLFPLKSKSGSSGISVGDATMSSPLQPLQPPGKPRGRSPRPRPCRGYPSDSGEGDTLSERAELTPLFR